MNQKLLSGLSVVIPVFNEEENIPDLFTKLNEFSSKAKKVNLLYQFTLVDGCSTDNTAEVIAVEIMNYPSINVQLLRMNLRRGYGYDILEGLKHSMFDTFAWTHADLQTDLNDLFAGYKIINASLDPCVVKGKRINRAFSENFFTFGMQVFTYFYLKEYLDDINAQPKILKASFFDEHLNDKGPHDFSLDLFFLMQAKKNSLPIKSFDVSFQPRVAGLAKGGGGSWKNRLNLIRRTIRYIIARKK
jgi:polyisoprenyl-phosphate glycosyltransferase